ncbi:restriction endonuclease subunit S [Advenella sp. WQ 585]|uniref:Restriction endonuclease subunit S n=1 Tax=Advenella mandrilli TaxID=2800330 RepID=A0ABS1EFD4_9BURK|nr:restriction endonuclease subunit S [Advenella mandrilli]MBK1781076.1 restriction endonuclease subunit S [Advenella mandrilli]
MQFKQYPSYKNSGVEWLGDVPKHWQVKPNKYVFKIQKRIAGTLGFNVLSITQKGLKIKDIESNAGQMAQDYSKYQIVNVGDFAMNHMDLLTGWVDIAKVTGVTSPDYRVFEVRNKKVNKEYFLHLFQLGYRNKILFAFGQGAAQMGRWRLQSETFNSLKMPFPSIEEQEKIVSFLDTETARIDTLIAKQEKLIELLEEQRKSIISHAVTKGLNPNAPMKDSGVEWLGEVPEHWTVLKNRHIFNFSKGLSITKENLQESGIPCVSYGEVHSKFGFEFNPEINDMKFVSEEYLETSKNCLLNSGDFIFADTSEDFEGSGNFSYLNSNSQVFAGYHTVIARLKSKQKPRFFAYIFDSNAHRKQIQTQVKGIKVFSITQGILKDIYSWLPPVHEQDLIVEYLDNECKKISLLKAKQIELIEKLKEYRSSIISHAVTGKIDVREFDA